jgi:hypothetical protein
MSTDISRRFIDATNQRLHKRSSGAANNPRNRSKGVHAAVDDIRGGNELESKQLSSARMLSRDTSARDVASGGTL